LASLLRRIGRVPPDKALETAHQICAGLAAAHDYGLLHRDLKPANIMLDGRGRVRITDFGLALSSDDASGRSETAGTPAYMAPEQIGKGEASFHLAAPGSGPHASAASRSAVPLASNTSVFTIRPLRFSTRRFPL
jgi:serine/threonine protein kinase